MATREDTHLAVDSVGHANWPLPRSEGQPTRAAQKDAEDIGDLRRAGRSTPAGMEEEPAAV